MNEDELVFDQVLSFGSGVGTICVTIAMFPGLIIKVLTSDSLEI